MRIAFLCPSISRACGGIFEIERRLAQTLAGLPDTSIQILSTTDDHSHADLPSWLPLRPECFPYIGPSSFRYSAGLRRALDDSQADIAHVHALWMYNSILIQRWSRRAKRPYVITVNGMLEPWAIRNSKWKKRLALTLYERRCLQSADCIQVNSEAELRSVRDFGLRNPVCVIPNGTDVPDIRTPAPTTSLQTLASGRRIILYLGRLHPKKGLMNLLYAWKKALDDCPPAGVPWVLGIAGWDQAGHDAELRGVCSKLGLEKSVAFVGPQFGAAKEAHYATCDAFVLPSFSEGLPMVVLEAWAHGKPVLMTPGCNLPEGYAEGAAIKAEATIKGLTEGLIRLLAMSDSERRTMGECGLRLVRERFAWPKIASDIKAVYDWVVGVGNKPQCVLESA